MLRKTVQANVKPAPPPNLNKQLERVWIGWCDIGDREVAREAASKGTHIPLALDFLAARKDWDHSDVDRWFKTEILAWVYNLLERKQIFRASHILSNVGIDPFEQLAVILCETADKTLRNYIAEHLIKNQKIESSILSSWKLINALENTKTNVFDIDEDISKISISKFDKKSLEWKSKIATELFFDTYDFDLEVFLLPEVTWTYLLSKEKLIILKIWINVYYTKDLAFKINSDLEPEIFQKLKNIFMLWNISNSMIDQVKAESYPDIVKDFILNELSTFGIICTDEKSDILQVVSRFVQSGNVQDIYSILEEHTSCMSVEEFNTKLVKYCLEHKLYKMLTLSTIDDNLVKSLTKDIDCRELKLWLKVREIKDDPLTPETLYTNTTVVLDFCSGGDIRSYLRNNPLILLACIIFKDEVTFHDIIMNKQSVTIEDLVFEADEIIEVISQMPVMADMIKKYSSKYVPPSLNLYELIEKADIAPELFNFRTLNTEYELPHFNNVSLQKKYGLQKSLNYLYYVKRCRPSKATEVFYSDLHKSPTEVGDTEKSVAVEEVHKLAHENYADSSVLSSCIAFTEMIGVSSEDIRILASVVTEIRSSKLCNDEELHELFSNVSENSIKILDTLEMALLERYKSCSEEQLPELILDNKLAVQFAKAYNLDLPTKVMIHCAQKNAWLAFLMNAEIYSYPYDYTLKLLTHFESECLSEHLQVALTSNLDMEDSDESMKTSSVSHLTSSVTSTSRHEPEVPSPDTIDFAPTSNLLKVMMQCHTSADPPRSLLQACQYYDNPLFAIFATCYEPDSYVICWLTWLSVSVDIKINAENCSMSSDLVLSFIKKVVQDAYVRTCWESFKIFLPENPLCAFFEFLYTCTKLEFEESAEHLKMFNQLVSQLKCNTVVPQNDYEYTYLNNSYWIIEVTLRCIFVALQSCFLTRIHQINFLDALCAEPFPKNIPVKYPDFRALSKLISSIAYNRLDIDFSLFDDSASQKTELLRCIEILTSQNQFNEALELAKYGNITEEYFSTKSWLKRFITFTKEDFWSQSKVALDSAKVSLSFDAEFYVNCVDIFEENSDRYKSLKCAYESLKQCDYSLEHVQDIEQKIWIKYFALDDDTLRCSDYERNEKNYLLSEILSMVNTECRTVQNLDRQQLRHLEETIAKILDSGDIIQAMRLEKIFNHKDVELSILMTMFELAEGRLSPYDISAEQRLLFQNRDMNLKSLPLKMRHMRRTRSSNISTSSLDSSLTVVPAMESEEIPLHDTLALLETMADRLKHGSNIGARIFISFRISVNIGKTYEDIVTTKDSTLLLRWALHNDCKNKLEVVHDVFILFRWTKDQIINFTFEEMKSAVKKSISLSLEKVVMWDLELDTKFHLILQLCSENSSDLGEKLLDETNENEVSKIYSDTEEQEKELTGLIELLIRAHDCFNTYCNIEGIAAVLRRAQSFTSILLNFKKWTLMVRLLTGIGRYTDMTYIFQILKEHDQFEYLLKRNLRNDNALKVALLKFLKQYCPKNKELHSMVALHFKLFSEVAQLLEKEAADMIHNLLEVTKLEAQNQGKTSEEFLILAKNESTISSLERIMNAYKEAAEYHLHGEKFGSAMKAARQAELVALQISLLRIPPNENSAKCILKLSTTSKQIYYLVMSEFGYPQARILTESYEYEVDWAEALFEHCIVNADMKYLEDFLYCAPLTNALVQDVAKRFLIKNVTAPASVNVMKEMIKQLDSVAVKYKIASELGLSDVVQSLLVGHQLAFLKDTVWKTGYKQM